MPIPKFAEATLRQNSSPQSFERGETYYRNGTENSCGNQRLRCLYLAVSRNTFETLFQEEAGQLLLEEPDFRMIVFDFISEEIIQWKPQINP